MSISFKRVVPVVVLILHDPDERPGLRQAAGAGAAAEEQEFGCRAIDLVVEGGKATGEMNCSEKVGRRLAVTARLRW